MSSRLQKVEEETLTLNLEEQGVWRFNENNLILASHKEACLSVDYLDEIIPSLKEKYPDVFEELKRAISNEEMISISDLILRVGHLCAVSASVGNKFIDAFERRKGD
jgi:hypothetical protein